MKSGIHPKYDYVMFRDVSADFEFVSRSCATSKETATWNEQEIPLIRLDISSASHPFYTGTQKIIDTAGRVERFYRKYGFQQQVDNAEDITPDEA